jgi:protein MPE1
MASSVFFKFKSQKEPTRVVFDGTGISVFELKREIIVRSGLGDGTEFDLAIYADDELKEGKHPTRLCPRKPHIDPHDEVYDDDTSIIPRSTTVIARRLPPKAPGKGSAARYVSGKMPVHAKNASRKEHANKASNNSATKAIAQMNNAMTEEEKFNALFNAQSSNWSAVEESLSQYVLSSPLSTLLRK